MKNQTINLDNGMAVIVFEPDHNGLTVVGLREGCPDCGDVNCERSCPAQAERMDYQREDEKDARIVHNAALNGLESLILALACAGYRIDEPKFAGAVQTAIDAIANKYE